MENILLPIEREVGAYTEDDYEQMIEDVYGETVDIAGMTFNTVYALKELDPTAYNVGFNDFQEYKTVYDCPVCEYEHDDEDDAKWCCQEHPSCPECGEEHDHWDDAYTCCPGEDEEESED